MGIQVLIMDHVPTIKEDKNKKTVKPIPLKKFGEYCEGEDGNTIISIQFSKHSTLAILDSGTSVAKATKNV